MASISIQVEPPYLRKFRIQEKLVKRVDSDRPRGYNPEILNTERSINKYVCSFCQWILRNPLQSFCGHRYCSACLEYILCKSPTEPVKCQLCVQEGTETDFSILKKEQSFPDNGVRRELDELLAVCLNEGCSWTGTFKLYQNHESSCQYKEVECKRCGLYMKEEKLAEHEATSCPLTPDKCPHCLLAMKKGMLQLHDCDKMPVRCHLCEKSLIKEQLYEHSEPGNRLCKKPDNLPLNSPNKLSPVVPCLFGCPEIIPVAILKQHLSNDLDGHIAELNRKIRWLTKEMRKNEGTRTELVPNLAARAASNSEQKLESFDKRLVKVEAQIDEILEKVSGLGHPPTDRNKASTDTNKQTEILDKKVLIFERISAVFKKEIEKCGKQIDTLLMENQENKDKLQDLERRYNLQKSLIDSIQIQLDDLISVSYDGVLYWKITSFHRRRQEAIRGEKTSFYSSPFFTSRTGYKARARIYLNGDGMGKGSYVSLFFVLMRGEYDALLPWPFQQKVTMVWIDQNRKENIVDTFRPDPTSSSFKRPTSDMNVASGCPLFMKLSVLDSPNQGYVKDDTAFITISIDTTNLGDITEPWKEPVS